MLVLPHVDARRWLIGANLLLAAGVVLPAVLAIPTLLSQPSAAIDIDAVGYAWLAAVVCFPTASLLGLAATGHWRRWPLRWLLQMLALALPLLLLVIVLFVH